MARIIQTENGKLKRQFVIQSELVSIGRSETNLIQLDELIVSSQHAKILTKRDKQGHEFYFLMDLDSTNGSFVNQDKVSCMQLRHRDSLRFGHESFTFLDD